MQTKTTSSADDPSMFIDDHFQCGGNEEDYVKKMISVIGSEVCAQLFVCVCVCSWMGRQ